MDAALNPFAPGAGTQPPELTGREQDLEKARVILERIKAKRPARSALFVGLRGVGKTVMLNRIQKIAEAKDYLSVLIESPEDKSLVELIAPPLRQILLKLDLMKGAKTKLYKAISALRSVASAFEVSIGDIGIGIKPSPGTADSGSLERDLVDLLICVGEAALEKETAIALFIDELQYVKENDLGALLAGIHRVNQMNLPLVIFGAGLPQLTGLTGNAKSYAERLFEFRNIGPLKIEDAKKAIKDPIEKSGANIDDDALLELVTATEGYPYFLQEWGSHAWDHAESNTINLQDVKSAGINATLALDESFFRVRFDRLSKSEKEYLRAMAELGKGPHRSGDIAIKLKRQVQQIAPTRASAIAKGMIYAPSYGDNDFTVPKFDEYMRRVMPEFTPHAPKKRGSKIKK